MQTVRIFSQDLDRVDRSAGQFAFTSDWNLPRKHTFTYYTDKDGEQAAAQAYHIFNAPEGMLNEFERHIVANAREHSHDMHSLSVGDVVRVGDAVENLCARHGWLSRRYA